MQGSRARGVLMLLPALLVVGVLFGGSMIYGLLQSLGWQPVIGRTRLSLDAYRSILTGAEYSAPFWSALAFSAAIAAVSTVASAVLAIAAALVLRRAFLGKRLASFLLQFSLPIPHLVAAIGMLFLLSQSGLVARAAAAVGLIAAPLEFPVLVRDTLGVGIVVAYLWKEIPFIGLIVLATLQSLGQDHEEAARTLGARPWQRFARVTFPLIRPAVVSTSLIVFAYVFGAYEIPAVLGVRYPRALPVLAYQLFSSPDLNDRSIAMAVSVVLSLLVIALVAGVLAAEKRGSRQ